MASTAHIVDTLQEETFKAGETICKINEPADKFWIIMDGWIQVKKEVSTKAKKLVADAQNDLGVDFSVEIGPGDFLGEAGLFEDSIKRNATCTAITDV